MKTNVPASVCSVRYGASVLADAELLAILIGSGTQGFSALDVARALLQRFGSLTELAARDVSELRAIRGMGMVRAVTLAAAFELARRLQAEPFTSRKIIRSPADVAQMFIPRLRGARTESFRVLLLNAANQMVREVVVSEGTLTASLVHPREVFRLAITESAAAVILLHNHPSGNTEPSSEDIALTRQLVQAGSIVGIPVLDHVIIAGETYVSLRERGVF
ncbi:MAG: DNA repair protein RadC [Candidatus Kapabacteria bacterium]|nr:DNA repair protein RadC [Candidatus Kapabacteria bacterium]MDW8012897.1 DNA repair protein RadC [Bacteroidota bacterium]